MIAVLGATGNIARHIVDALIATGERPRVVTRNRTRTSWDGEKVELCEGDIRSDEFRARALEGADKIFTLSFVEEDPTLLRDVLGDAGHAGVGHIVLLSSVGASSSISIGRKHAGTEEAVSASGIASTFLRPGYLMSNTLRWASGIRRDGRVSAVRLHDVTRRVRARRGPRSPDWSPQASRRRRAIRRAARRSCASRLMVLGPTTPACFRHHITFGQPYLQPHLPEHYLLEVKRATG